jgi:ADP-ribose pyrophosphatase YjhB (NUDIX family)
VSRVPMLVPVRYGRMLVSPFTFYRGAALIMPSDLAATPFRGLPTGQRGLFADETVRWQTSGMVLGANARSTQLAGFVLLTRKEQVLLVKQAYGLGLWALPGGLASPGETVEAAAMREANEETGLDVELGGVVSIADRESVVLVVFAGSVRGGQLRAEPGEIEEVRWFSKKERLVVGDSFAFTAASRGCSWGRLGVGFSRAQWAPIWRKCRSGTGRPRT